MVAEVENGHAGNGAPPLLGHDFAAPPAVPVDPSESVPPPSQPTSEPTAAAAPQPVAITPTAPPPGWYGDIYGNPLRWWDGTVWTEHLLIPLPSSEPAADDGPELNFFDNALISLSLMPDWGKFLAAAVVTAILALIGLGLLSGDSGSGGTPDGFVPQEPALEQEALPSVPDAPETAEPEGSVDR